MSKKVSFNIFEGIVELAINGKQWCDVVYSFGSEEVEKLNVWLDLMEFVSTLEDKEWKSLSQVKSHLKNNKTFVGLVLVLKKWGEFEKVKTEEQLEARIEYLSAYCFSEVRKGEVR